MSEKHVLAAGIIIGICISVAAIFLYKSFIDFSEYDAADDSYRELIEAVVSDKGGEEDDNDSSDSESSGESPDSLLSQEHSCREIADADSNVELPEIDFQKLKEINGNVVAWIYAPGTVINYPIVQCADDDYYLTHLFDGSKNKNGCIFMESGNKADFSDDNTVIYGHNMASGSMFAGLLEYEDSGYARQHPYMYLITEEETYRVELFAAYVTEPESDAYTIRLGTEERFREWVLSAVKKSTFKVGMKMTASDRVITLSTCSYEYKNARFVVHGRLVRM